jgi:hypothetical protein
MRRPPVNVWVYPAGKLLTRQVTPPDAVTTPFSPTPAISSNGHARGMAGDW